MCEIKDSDQVNKIAHYFLIMHIADQNKELKGTLRDIEDLIQENRIYFTSSKFHGENDWVRTHEILARLDQMKQAIISLNDKLRN